MESFENLQPWETRDARIIRFRKPFSEKYTLTVDTDILAGNFPIQTKTQIRWALRVINVDNLGQAEIELITIENRLVETNNPNLQDIAALSQAFGRMYSEIHVKLNSKGKVLEILNLPAILGKWEETKAEMQKIEKDVPAMVDVVKLNDEIFATPDKVKLAIENNEFFTLYFHLICGQELPLDDLKRKNRNMFNSADVDWRFDARGAQSWVSDVHVTDVAISGQPAETLGLIWVNEAYSAFQMVDFTQLNPRLSETGQYRFQTETGKLLKAVLTKKEVANPDYIRGEMTYKLKADGEIKDETQKSQPDGEKT